MSDLTSADIPALNQRVRELRHELNVAEAALREARIAAAPFQVGDIVECRRDGQWQPAIIRTVRSRWGDRCEYEVSFRRKDGTWMDRKQHAYGEMRKPEAS